MQTLTGRKQQFDVEPTTTVRDGVVTKHFFTTLCVLQVRELKAELQEKEGIESKQIRLVYGGKKM